MNAQELAQQVNNTIQIWSRGIDKLVVAIDGYTGIGKTTLLNNLVVLNPDIIVVHCDDFRLPRKTVEKKLANTDDRSRIFELEVCDDKKLENFVCTFKNTSGPYQEDIYDDISGEANIQKTYDFSKKIMVIEGVFMFHPQGLNHIWDRRIYLEGDIQKIDERRVKREKERWGKDYFPETHPDSYFGQVIIALKRYKKMYHPEKSADVVLHVDEQELKI